MIIYDGRILVYDSHKDFDMSQIDVDSLERAGGKDRIQLMYHDNTGIIVPYDKSKPVASPDFVQLKDWITNVIRNPNKLEMAGKGLKANLAKAGIEVTDEQIQRIVYAPYRADSQKNASVEEGLLAYVASNDFQVKSLIQKRVLKEDVRYPHPNETLETRLPHEEVNVRLPDPDLIMSYRSDRGYLNVGIDLGVKCIPNPLYKLKFIARILSAKTSSARISEINKAMDSLRDNYRYKPSDEELSAIKNFKVLPLEHVLGDESNDNIDIMPNEKPLYENLIAFMKYHIKRFNREMMPNASEEEIDAKSEEDYNKGNLPVRLTEYLALILEEALKTNFYHTGNFLYAEGDFGLGSEKEDDGNSDKESTTDDMNFVSYKEDNAQSNLDVIAFDYVLSSARRFGAQVFAEAIVKSLRFGERKIKNLVVGRNNTQMLDLYTMSLITQQAYDFTNFETYTDEEGRFIDPMSFSYIDFTPSDSNRAMTYPFVVVGTEAGVIKDTNQEIDIIRAMTLFEIVKDYVNGTPSLYSLSFDGEKFFYEEEDKYPLKEISIAEVISAKVGYRDSEDLTEFAIDNGVMKVQGPVSSVINSFAFEEFRSADLLLDRMVDTPAQFRNSVLQGGLLAVFSEGAQDYDYVTFTDLLNWYYKEVYPVHLAGYNKIFGIESDEKPVVNTRNLKAMQLFTEPEETEEEEFMHQIYDGDAKQLQFHKIVKSPKDDTLIGGFAVVDNVKVYAAVDEITSFALQPQVVHTGNVVVSLWELNLAAETKNGYASPNRVMSAETLFKIYKTLYGK